MWRVLLLRRVLAAAEAASRTAHAVDAARVGTLAAAPGMGPEGAAKQATANTANGTARRAFKTGLRSAW